VIHHIVIWTLHEAYQSHPQHQAVAAQLGPMRSERRVVDFERP